MDWPEEAHFQRTADFDTAIVGVIVIVVNGVNAPVVALLTIVSKPAAPSVGAVHMLVAFAVPMDAMLAG